MPRWCVDARGAIEDTGYHNTTVTLPGFANGHSHAFQRALRGRVERRPLGEVPSSFWTWREAMYADANRLDLASFRVLARWAFGDMVRAGFTSVGEFHYLHHVRDAGPLETATTLVEVAREVGIRLTLLLTAYEMAGFGRARLPEQARFCFDGELGFLDHSRRVRELFHDGTEVTVGLALHSVRACGESLARGVIEAAAAWRSPLHIHACEQRREVEDCYAAHGCSPIALLDRWGALSPRTTIVHGTHLDAEDVLCIASRGARVCLTPSTERNLGDGLGPIRELLEAGVELCIGTDSHARIDPLDELRSLEEQERLRHEQRTVLVKPGQTLTEALLPIGTSHGLRALGFDDDRHGCTALTMPLEGLDDPRAGLDAILLAGRLETDTMCADGRLASPMDDDEREAIRRVLASLRHSGEHAM